MIAGYYNNNRNNAKCVLSKYGHIISILRNISRQHDRQHIWERTDVKFESEFGQVDITEYVRQLYKQGGSSTNRRGENQRENCFDFLSICSSRAGSSEVWIVCCVLTNTSWIPMSTRGSSGPSQAPLSTPQMRLSMMNQASAQKVPNARSVQ